MHPLPERPQLQPYLTVARDPNDPRHVYLWDRLGLADGPQRFTFFEFVCLQLFDGKRTLREAQAEAMRQVGGELLPLETFVALVKKLDEARFLEGPRFRERLDNPVREPSCVGCYPGDADTLRDLLRDLFERGSGPPRPRQPDGKLHAALVPHIDYARGGLTYTWAFKEVCERSAAALFVIIGTSHYSGHRFTLTRKHFKTPLGVAATDQAYLDRLVAHYGDGLFADEHLAHLPEHSIELEVVFLQYLFEGRRPFRIVPLVVGSFHDCVADGGAPSEQDDVARMVEALRRAEAQTPEPVCYLISGDLAHLGPKFGDPGPVDAATLAHSRKQDHALLKRAETADAAGFFRVIADEADRRRICGLPPTYTLLEAVRPTRGKLLHYDQYVHPRGHESVSFASVAFYR